MTKTLYFVAPMMDKDALMKTCIDNQAEAHWHSIPDAHSTALFLLVRPRVSLYLAAQSKYPSFPDLNDKQTTITKELVAAFPASAGLTEQDTTHSALLKIHTTLGMAAMHPHR
jgi:hypothetical protein